MQADEDHPHAAMAGEACRGCGLLIRLDPPDATRTPGMRPADRPRIGPLRGLLGRRTDQARPAPDTGETIALGQDWTTSPLAPPCQAAKGHDQAALPNSTPAARL